MQYLIHLKKAHRAEVDEVLSRDPLLEKELDFDLKRHLNEEENQDKGFSLREQYFSKHNLSGGHVLPITSPSDHTVGTPTLVSKISNRPISISKIICTPNLKERLGGQFAPQLKDMDLNSPYYKRGKSEGVIHSLGSGGSEASRSIEGYDLAEGSKRKRGAKMGVESLSSLLSNKQA